MRECLNDANGNVFKVLKFYRSYRIERSLSGKKPTVDAMCKFLNQNDLAEENYSAFYGCYFRLGKY